MDAGTKIVPGTFLSEKNKGLIALASGILFLLICLMAIRQGTYLIWIVPPALIIVLLGIYALDHLFILLLFLVPLSVQLRFLTEDPSADLFLPTELILVGILLIMIYKIFNGKDYNRKLLFHNVSISIIVMLCWMFITALSGTMIIVSLKYFIARLWFITAFYFLALELFRRPGMMNRSISALMAGMVPVILYNIFRLWQLGLFNQKEAHSTMWPFFNDHTSFGAAIAFLIPLAVFYIIRSKSGTRKLAYILILMIFIAGMIFSYSRAAWLSLFVSALFVIIMLLRIPWKLVFSICGVIMIITIFSFSSILQLLEKNRQDSSGNMGEHIQSMVNITSDASNMERINRWKSALRMISEKPLTGWGPGTYQFQYAPYQYSYERTLISTNFGERGNAHSEYLGSMVESGVPGTIFFMVIIILSAVSGYRVWRKANDRLTRYLALALMAGLLTYVIHGFLNNFLDTDKISAPFWTFIAGLVVLDMELGYREG
jgi:O-antigen ligase